MSGSAPPGAGRPGRWRRTESQCFTFAGRSFDPESGVVELHYRLDDLDLCEQLRLPSARLSERRRPAVTAALDLLHWVAGISYWKAGCPSQIAFETSAPDPEQAAWLNCLYRHGLAEFAYRNQLEPELFNVFSGSGTASPAAAGLDLERRTLVPMGGGKDSLVAWSRLQRHGDRSRPVQVGSAPLIRRLGQALAGDHLVIERRLDPALAELNALGAWNGHVPVTAISAAILVLVALVLDYDRVAFANERSADEATLHDSRGRPVNHQFSKSLVFERMLDDWIRRWIAPDLRVFSLLRRDGELGICREFAGLESWHGLFSSCNRNFHLDGPRTSRWCGHCPKCHFVFLGLAPFMAPLALGEIFGADLLDDARQIDGFAALLGLDGRKPFECVGEAGEARAALASLAQLPDWAEHAVVRALVPRLAGLQLPTLEQACRPGGPHLIPAEWLDAA